ncbi:beta-galactosidase, partial [Paenarthrobacter aurescens]|uniref:beta-galactosidase n=1 Tax=Paenarthrobacter aurescens TaxID=43663 RepID=UPI0021C160BA
RDFSRFHSWAFIDYARELLAVIREVTPDVPATTNFLVSSATKALDYFDWSKDMDVVANDHDLVAADPEREIELAFSA